MRKHALKTLCTAILVLFVMIISACPSGSVKNSHLTIALTTDAETLQKSLDTKAGPVYAGDIESLIVTVTEVSLDKTGQDVLIEGEGEGEGEVAGKAEGIGEVEGEEEGEVEGEVEGEGEPDLPKNREIVFSGSMDVDIIQLDGISEILSSANVPAGSYTKIRIAIKNPRLVMKSDLDTVITDVHLTANGHLFVSQKFELPEGGDKLLLLNFNGIHLVEQGNGGYTLTPQMRADITITSANTQVEGILAELDADSFVLELGEDGEVNVTYDETTVITGGDLADGQTVLVTGRLAVDGTVTSETIEILE